MSIYRPSVKTIISLAPEDNATQAIRAPLPVWRLENMSFFCQRPCQYEWIPSGLSILNLFSSPKTILDQFVRCFKCFRLLLGCRLSDFASTCCAAKCDSKIILKCTFWSELLILNEIRITVYAESKDISLWNFLKM